MNKEILDWFEGNELAANVWYDKYAIKDVERTPEDTIIRLTDEFHRIEQKYPNPLTYREIYDLLKGFKKVIPAGSPIFGIGNKTAITSLSNCYVVDSPIDSYGGIMKTDQELAQLMKRRGGVGVDISTLRPAGSRVSNSAGSSTGAVSFMSRFSNTTREVAQEGRRGALIITIDISHPDSQKFILSKDDLTQITGANISVKITDEFMQAVLKNGAYEVYHSRQKGEKPIFINAREVFKTLVHQAWKTAEPGVLFWDRIIKESPADCYDEFKTISTNPCGELPLCAYDSCRLMHVNVYEYIINPFTKDAYFDIDSYKEDVYKAQKLMDDMIDLEAEKLERIIDKIRKDPEDLKIKEIELNLWLNIRRKLILGRRTGLNPLLGLADALAALGYKYDSDEAISVAEMMAAAGATSAYMSSIHMGMERGPFAVWNLKTEQDNPFLNRILDCLDGNTVGMYKSFGRRNISCLTIPPSGTISIISQVSSGIEPVFNLSYNRKRKVSAEHPNKSYQDKNGDWWEEYEVYHPKLLKWMKTVEEGKHDGVHNPYRGSTTNEIDPLQKVRMQGVIQQWIDHSISITHNLPENIKEEDVFNIYVEAWRNGCKGCTIYREGSRDGILTNKKKIVFEQHDAPKRPKELICNVHSTKVRGEEFIVVVGLLEDKPYEVFVMRPNGVNPLPKKHKIIKLSKGNYILTTLDWNNKDQGYNFGPITESLNDEEKLITRLISTSLRHGSDINFVVQQLDKSEGDITSFGRAIARVLKKYVVDTTQKRCSECNTPMITEGGCEICPNCGNSKCS
jgi:ribonucleoside-diphosphate reductase alpha chain